MFKNEIADEQLSKIGSEKDPIKRRVQFNLEKKEKFRVIESKDKRIVHFLFNPTVPSKISPFARKYTRFLDGSLAEFEEEEKEKFRNYVSRLQTEELEDGETNPVVFEDMPFFHFELSGGINRLCFSTADDPFYKQPVNKYYPECVILNEQGEIVARVGPDDRKNADYHMTYQDDFRDAALKINDDRKIQI